jgi:broad specificity phosphatase PhoE
MPTVFLVRHGEVANPHHVVYGDLPGFNLSPRGVLQAHAAAAHLAGEPIEVVLTSPLARATQTATAIARPHHLTPVPVPALTEAGCFPSWTGQRWDDLPAMFGDQLDRYLTDASQLTDAHETLDDIAGRVIGTIVAAIDGGAHTIAVVAHQDPLQAARLVMLGRPLAELLVDPPPHASVTTMVSDDTGTWQESATWEPAIGE